MPESTAAGPGWWKGATIYQIYPRSFLDTTGNGLGDLKGIARKLDYVADLGVDAIWISPFVKSPMLDLGYDVSDYLAVDPLFGTLDDFHELLDAAHERGLRIIMDQVLSHTSSEHPWFLESRESKDNPKADWYVWADCKPDGSPPNNWLSVFGGSSWQWEPRRDQYYLHNFLREQPDLNFHNEEVQQALLDACRFWLDLGVDGFRLDVCTFYLHDSQLRDNPPNPELPTGEHFHFNPYSRQLHTRDIAQPENVRFLERLRALTDAYEDRILLGELHENEGVRIHRDYTDKGRLHLAYGYWLLGAHDISAADLADLSETLGHEMGDGWPCWALDNHDFSRAVSRLGFEDHPDAFLVRLVALTCLRGATCIYQGSELGLPQAAVPYERITDRYGREFYPAFMGRDGSRTPMPWNQDLPHAGFSTAEPWLPITAPHTILAVDQQERTPGSTLNRLRTFLNWRKQQAALLTGAIRFGKPDQDVLTFTREGNSETIACIFNLGDKDRHIRLEGNWSEMHGHGFGSAQEETAIHLPACGAWFGTKVP